MRVVASNYNRIHLLLVRFSTFSSYFIIRFKPLNPTVHRHRLNYSHLFIAASRLACFVAADRFDFVLNRIEKISSLLFFFFFCKMAEKLTTGEKFNGTF